MKRTIGTLILSLSIGAAFSQACVVNAYNALNGGELNKASTYIEECMDNPKATEKEKTWRYRGQIYMAIAQNADLKATHPDALQKSAESFLKAKEIDTKGSYESDNNRGLQILQIMALNSGVEDYNAQSYTSAISKFEVSKKIAESKGAIDTLAIYNIGLSQERSGNPDAAIESYNKCAELGYNTPNIYLFIATIYKNSDRKDKALEVLEKARVDYPREPAIIIEMLNIYLEAGRFEEALENLRVAAELDPNNEILFFSMGSVSDNLGKFDEAEEAYKKAISIKPTYFDANYNLGAMYYNRAVEKVNQCNEIPPNQQKKYDECIAESTKIFEQAVPFLETALEANPEDDSTLQSLKNAYVRTGQDDKYMEIKKKLGE
jgi:tetratricopeptide (TPR) repeat protein